MSKGVIRARVAHRRCGRRRLAPWLVLLGLLAACGGGGVDCEGPDTVLVEHESGPLTCAQAGQVADYVHVLAARSVPTPERKRVLASVRDRYKKDPEGTAAWLEEVAQAGRALELLTGLEGAEQRARLVFKALQGQGPITEAHGEPYAIQRSVIAPWGTDEAEGMALTEADIEGWIRYASLCRQVQGGGTVALSVSDRVQVYRMVQERFARGDRKVKVALTSLGPYWSQIHDAWEAASYERQQAWIGAAPLPPPMTATSLGYIEALLQGDLQAHARVLHERIGPFTMVKGRRAFPDG